MAERARVPLVRERVYELMYTQMGLRFLTEAAIAWLGFNDDESRKRGVLGKNWESRAQQIGSELEKLHSHTERAALLLGCAAIFAREAELTPEEFEALARQAFDAAAG